MKSRYRLILMLLLKISLGQALAAEDEGLSLRGQNQAPLSKYCLVLEQEEAKSQKYFLVKDFDKLVPLEQPQVQTETQLNLLAEENSVKVLKKHGCK